MTLSNRWKRLQDTAKETRPKRTGCTIFTAEGNALDAIAHLIRDDVDLYRLERLGGGEPESDDLFRTRCFTSMLTSISYCLRDGGAGYLSSAITLVAGVTPCDATTTRQALESPWEPLDNIDGAETKLHALQNRKLHEVVERCRAFARGDEPFVDDDWPEDVMLASIRNVVAQNASYGFSATITGTTTPGMLTLLEPCNGCGWVDCVCEESEQFFAEDHEVPSDDD